MCNRGAASGLNHHRSVTPTLYLSSCAGEGGNVKKSEMKAQLPRSTAP